MANGILNQELDFYSANFHNAGFHNSIYRGQNLGTSVTTEQQNEISAGTFNNLFIGDYWVINDITWRIAAFDYFYKTGDAKCTTRHILLIPDLHIGTAKHQNSNTTTGGYKASLIWTNWFASATGTGNAIFNNAFGAEHALSHRELLTNAVANGKSSGWEWIDVPCGNLLNEYMICGTIIWGSQFDVGVGCSQLPLFALAPELLTTNPTTIDYHLSTVASATGFNAISAVGRPSGDRVASYIAGIRPYFVYA